MTVVCCDSLVIKTSKDPRGQLQSTFSEMVVKEQLYNVMFAKSNNKDVAVTSESHGFVMALTLPPTS